MSENVNFVLEGLETTIQMSVLGQFTGTDIPLLDVDAAASLNVSLSDMQSMFNFHTDSIDINNENADDVVYYVVRPESLSINPSDAVVDASAVDVGATLNAVKHDFVRHIAKDLFNTHHGVDLFENEEEMVTDLHNKGDDAWTNDISAKLDAANAKTNADTSSSNLCRVLFRQLVKSKPERFQQLDVLSEPDLTYKMPFIAGDSISFKVLYKAKEDQQSIINRQTAVADRSYAIKLNLVA